MSPRRALLAAFVAAALSGCAGAPLRVITAIAATPDGQRVDVAGTSNGLPVRWVCLRDPNGALECYSATAQPLPVPASLAERPVMPRGTCGMLGQPRCP